MATHRPSPKKSSLYGHGQPCPLPTVSSRLSGKLLSHTAAPHPNYRCLPDLSPTDFAMDPSPDTPRLQRLVSLPSPAHLSQAALGPNASARPPPPGQGLPLLPPVPCHLTPAHGRVRAVRPSARQVGAPCPLAPRSLSSANIVRLRYILRQVVRKQLEVSGEKVCHISNSFSAALIV